MSYSCSDFTDDILGALGIVVPEDARDDSAAQAGLAMDRIAELEKKAVAAPDLLAALESLVNWEEVMGGFESKSWDNARAAIAKARGEVAP